MREFYIQASLTAMALAVMVTAQVHLVVAIPVTIYCLYIDYHTYKKCKV